jgi:predicted permease
MPRLLFDVRLALRNLRRSPLFTCVAVASLALGIGANTAIFTLIDQLMLRLLPVESPEQLVMIWTTGPHMGNNRGDRRASYPMYQDFQRKAQAFASVFCRYGTPLSVSFGNRTERVQGELVSGNFFQALGVKPAIGRVLSPDQDDRVYMGHPVAVLSYEYWVTRFASDPGVVGRKILVDNYPMTVVGVSAAGFNGLDPSVAPQIRVPIQMKPQMTPGWDDMGDRRSQWVHLFARMKPGYSLPRAKASLQPLLSQVLRYELTLPDLRDASAYNRELFLKRQIKMEPAATGYSQTRESYRTALIVLMCMVGLVLLIACFNVANLLIARAAARQKEVAVRLAVGASRRQLLGQLLVESLILSLSGGAAGLLLAVAMIRGLLSFLPTDGQPLLLHASPDPRILAFNGGLAVLTGILFGLAPAWQSTRFNLWTTLKDAAGAGTGQGGSVWMRKVLVTAQVTLSFLLLAGAGLFVKTLANLKTTDSGFRGIGNLITMQVDPALNGYKMEEIKSFYGQALERIRATPGVTSAGSAAVSLLSGDEWDSEMGVEGHKPKDGEDMQAFMNQVSPGYFKTMGVRLLEGRDFDDRDTGPKTTVAVVNRSFATHFFGNATPIGRRIGFGGGPKSKLKIEIVGLVEDSLYEGPREGVHRQVFIPSGQANFPSGVAFYVRTSMPSSTMFGAMRHKIAELDPAIPVFGLKTLEHQLDETLSTERLIATLSAAFGVLATLLAALGLYGVLAFVVARRTREIGLRMALGAGRGTVVWMVMREALLLLGIGLATGLPVAFLLSKYVGSQLFGVQAHDGWTALTSLAILAVVAAVAGFLPARRASAIDPIRALRYE